MSDPSDHDLLASLPTAYAVVVRLERSGRSDEEIAVALGVEVSAVAGLRFVAHRKLADLRSSDPVSGDGDAPAPKE